MRKIEASNRHLDDLLNPAFRFADESRGKGKRGKAGRPTLRKKLHRQFRKLTLKRQPGTIYG
jgi:hypothetical protein